MDAEFIAGKNIEWIRASYIEEEDIPEYQIFYLFDSTGRIVESTTSDDIMTKYNYVDSIDLKIETKTNLDIGNRMITYSIGWKKIAVKIYNAQGDSIIHQLYYDTLRLEEKKYIECFDVILAERDTAFRQVFDLEGNLLLYEVFGRNGRIMASYSYQYNEGLLIYTEFYEGDEFVYKEIISYQEDSDLRKQRISVSGGSMFSDLENAYTTDYYINEEGLLIQESDFIGTELSSIVVYTYQFFVPLEKKVGP